MVALLWGVLLVTSSGASAQDEADLIDRPIARVVVDGLSRVDERLVRNQLRCSVGDPYDPRIVNGDVQRLTRLGDFRYIDTVVTRLNDGSIQVTYHLVEQAIIEAVEVVGNRLISDQDLVGVVRQFPGLPRDDYLIEKSKTLMEELYRKRGHYLTAVTIEEEQLDESGVLIFRVIEGPRVKVRAVAFEGNEAFAPTQLKSNIKTEKAIPLLKKGALDETVLSSDVQALNQFYKDRGYEDVRVDYRVDLSPDVKEAKVTFLVAEGRQYTLGSVAVETVDFGEVVPPKVFSPEQIAAMLEIKPGDVYRADLIRSSMQAIRDAYARLGRQGVQVNDTPIRRSDGPEVDLLIEIDEGTPTRLGLVHISGNFLTRDKVIRRELRLKPGRPIDGTEITRAQRRLASTRLFNDVRITLQEPDEEDPLFRDMLVEIKERNTGSVNFGLAVGSDSGLFGEFSVNQDNFDIADPPESFGELLRGAAFRGAGQKFNMTIRPGNELFQYLMSLTEPHLFESDYSGRITGSWRARQFNDYDEERGTALISVGRKLGDIWDMSVRGRYERVTLTDIDPTSPTEVFLDAGPDDITSIALSLTRTTIDAFTRPGSGSRFEFSWDEVGLLGGGDFSYSNLSADYTVYMTIDEDFLGRKSTLKLSSRCGYIFGGRAPTYERYYLGGRSLRGFEFRSVSPRGVQVNGQPSEVAVGGSWMFFAGAQYEFPIFDQAITGVVFSDTGTVLEDVGFDDYRVSLGVGVRLYIPALGPVPIAFDFAGALQKADFDETEVFSFNAELPF
ncbi:MAG: outer membrane protein assembly factor BamA [Planctomycetota bacterium]|jgi:outer membrane protein insertion porin family